MLHAIHHLYDAFLVCVLKVFVKKRPGDSVGPVDCVFDELWESLWDLKPTRNSECTYFTIGNMAIGEFYNS